MAAACKLGPERDGGKGVPRVAEGGEQDAAAGRGREAQISSASWRTVRFLPSGSKDMGETISVPTPASR